MLSQGSGQQQFADGQGLLMKDHTQPQQQSVMHSYQEQQVISNTHQPPLNMTSTSQSATVSGPSSLSSQQSNKSTGGKHVRVVDASGRDVQGNTVVDNVDHMHQERTFVQQSQPVSFASAQKTTPTSNNEYNDLEDIMASMSQFDVSCHEILYYLAINFLTFS